jgi:soluble lytic murein transglycosylase-like protein
MTKRRKSKRRAPRRAVRLVVAGVVILAALAIVDTRWLHILPSGGERVPAQVITDPDAPLAAFYSPEVRAWRADIIRWARTYHVNPNVIAIVIQIESCGDPEAISVAGALGLMQVMPFHFDNGENMLNPDTNVQEGMSVFYECLTQFADWDLGLALACYNGGPSVTVSDPSTWADETQHYYYWATGLWSDVVAGNDSSAILDEWLEAGGERLCHQAALVAQK